LCDTEVFLELPEAVTQVAAGAGRRFSIDGHQLTDAPADKQYLGSSFSPSFSEGEGWITVGRTPGYGEEGNADVFRVRIEGGDVVRSENLTKSEIWDSAPVWGSHPPVG
jgi:hypothetical protein